jgi:hypothetical protein
MRNSFFFPLGEARGGRGIFSDVEKAFCLGKGVWEGVKQGKRPR